MKRPAHNPTARREAMRELIVTATLSAHDLIPFHRVLPPPPNFHHHPLIV